MDSTSAREPRAPFRFWKCDASEAEHTGPDSATPSIERHSPLSLPTNSSSGFAGLHSMACWYSPTPALMHDVVLVVLRQSQPMARLHSHKSLAPAIRMVSWPDGTAASARL